MVISSGNAEPGEGPDGDGSADKGERLRGNWIDARVYGLVLVGLIAGVVYGVVTRATGLPLPASVAAGFGAGIATACWMERFDWRALSTTQRGWKLMAGSASAGIFMAWTTFAVTPGELALRIFAALTAYAIAFAGALAFSDHIVKP
ncbi:hypothetical protein [Nocardia mexicana]|uniref:Uncharacterized protein n=1 Tax=Nocardia mexicana TaxID=279262 RepID=A0A370HH02_9NOCA|nr:hypothetical protein [Nocardia mexicana]RDI56050.1 hypothetical protein DFR68_101887 [Nocardia mexicana]